MQDARAELDRLTSEPGPRTFANTMQRLDHLTERLEYAMQIVRNLEAVATTPELRAAYNAVQPKVSEFYSSLPLNEALVAGGAGLFANRRGRGLTGVRKRFLEKTMDNFRRHGAELNAEGKKRIAEIDVELTKQTIRFAENVLDSTNQYEWVITDERQLAGLPESARAMARASAASKGLPEPSWRFTLQGPSYLAVMTYLDDEGAAAARFTKPSSIAPPRRSTTTGRSCGAFWNCGARRPGCWAIATSRTWCWKTGWRTPEIARSSSWTI